jgi:molecular chaperone GrpE
VSERKPVGAETDTSVSAQDPLDAEATEATAARPVGRDDARGSEPPAPSGDAVAARLAEAEAKRDEYLDLAQRVQADFENYRKRAAREQERLVAHAHERLVRELLPILDDLERALEAAERHEEAALVEGVQLVQRSLRKALAKEGLAEIETEGGFDPHVHEALLTRPAQGAETGSVLEVVQRGYRVGDRVVRPAKVIVAE